MSAPHFDGVEPFLARGLPPQHHQDATNSNRNGNGDGNRDRNGNRSDGQVFDCKRLDAVQVERQHRRFRDLRLAGGNDMERRKRRGQRADEAPIPFSACRSMKAGGDSAASSFLQKQPNRRRPSHLNAARPGPRPPMGLWGCAPEVIPNSCMLRGLFRGPTIFPVRTPKVPQCPQTYTLEPVEAARCRSREGRGGAGNRTSSESLGRSSEQRR